MQREPLVSVILPVFNGEKYLRQALESIYGQSHTNLHVIGVDDGSRDSSREILASYGDKLTLVAHEHNRGIAAARNTALPHVRGEYVAFMDADDLWHPHKLSVQVAAMKGDPSLDILFCMLRCFISPDLPIEIQELRFCPPDPMPGYIAAATMVRQESLARIGAFDTRFTVGEFIDWFARAKVAGMRAALLPDVLLSRRIHASNTGVTNRSARGDYLRVVREALVRKNAQGSTHEA